MYNAHRGLGVPQPTSRITELLDQIRAEFENQAGRAGEYEQQVGHQIQEVEHMRTKVYQLEQQHLAMKEGYEKEIGRLQRELELRGGSAASAHSGGPQQHGGPTQPQPPAIGHGPSNLFGGIMAGGGGQAGSALAPPPQDQPAHQGLPAHLSQGAAMNTAGPPPPSGYGGYPPGVNGYGPQPPPPTSSPGPGKPRSGRGPPDAATPQQSQAAAYPGSPSRAPLPTPPPGQRQNLMSQAITNGNIALADLNLEDLPANQKKQGDEWWAVFNPNIRRVLDVDLIHTLEHGSVVCCVRFSQDGNYVATGCNRSAQIFEVRTGREVTKLEDPSSANREGDLYIRSVCFSPDGKYLATGAEDKIIRVWDIQKREIKAQFSGHDQDIYSLDFARNGRHIASGSGDRTVRVWDLEAQQPLLTLSIEDGVTTVALSSDGSLVAAGSLDKSVRVWDTSSGFPLERLEGAEGHKDSVYSVAFSPNGRQLVSGSLDKTIKMWELSPPRSMVPGGGKSGKCIRTFVGHKDFVLSVALTPDGEWVLSGSKDRGVQFWDPRTGEAQLHLQGHKNSVISVAPSPTGQLFATGSGDTRARIWRYDAYRP